MSHMQYTFGGYFLLFCDQMVNRMGLRRLLFFIVVLQCCVSCDGLLPRLFGDHFEIFIRFNNTSDYPNVYCILDKNVTDGRISDGSIIDLSPRRDDQVFSMQERWKKWEDMIKDSVAVYVVNPYLLIKAPFSDDSYVFGETKVLSDEDIERIPIESILVEYHISPSEFKKLNWSFSFPPDSKMKEIYMIPSYNSFH